MIVEMTPSAEWIWTGVVLVASTALWAAGDKRYVRRTPYHEVINTLTANTAKVQEDVNQLKTAVAVLTNSMVAMSANVQKAMEHNAEMSKTISEIRVDVGSLAATWKGAWALKHGQYPESTPHHPV